MRGKKKKEPLGQRTARGEPVTNGEMWHRMIEHSPLGYAILQEGRVVYSNKALSEICGFSSEELAEMTAEKVAEGIHADDRQRALAVMADRLRGKHPAAVQRLRIRQKNGATVGQRQPRCALS